MSKFLDQHGLQHYHDNLKRLVEDKIVTYTLTKLDNNIILSGSNGDTTIVTDSVGEMNVQSDWNENNISSDSYIKNKPDKKYGADGSSLVGKELFHLNFDDNFNADKSLKNADKYIVMGDARSIYMFSDGTPIHYVIIPMNKEVSSKDSEYAYFEVNSIEGLSTSSVIDFYHNRRFENGVWTQSSGQITFTAFDDGFIAKVPVEFLDRCIYTDSEILYTLFEGYQANTYSMKRTDNFDCQGIVTNIVYNSSTNKSTLTVTNAQPITSVSYEGIDLWLPYQPLAGDFSESQGAYSVGADNIVCGFNGFAAGFNNIVYSDYGTATGRYNKVTYGGQAHGQRNEAMGQWSVALGHTNKATAIGSFAAGRQNEATGSYSTAIGYKCKAIGAQSIALGHTTNASGAYSFTTGHQTNAAHNYSSAFGVGTKTGRDYQMVLGRNNAVDTDALFVIGNGSSSSSPKNVFTVAASDIKAAGNLTIDGKLTSGANGIETLGKIHTSTNLAVDGNATVTGSIISRNNISANGIITGSNIYLGANDVNSIQQNSNTTNSNYSFALGGYNRTAGSGYSGALGLYNIVTGYASVASGRNNAIIGYDYKVSIIKTKAITVDSTSYNAFVDDAGEYLALAVGNVVIAYHTTYGYIPVKVSDAKDNNEKTFYYISGNYNFNKNIYAEDKDGTAIKNIDELKNYIKSTASGSFTAGMYNIITGALASAFGNYNIVKSDKQTVVGSFNDPSSTAYFVVGGGTSESTRKNVFTVDDSGNTNSAGTISAKKLEATSEVDTVLVLTDNLTVRNNLLLKYTSLSLTENTANGGTAYKEYSTGGCSTGIYVINITLTNSDKSGAGDTASCTILYDGGSKYHSSQVSFITGTVNKTDFTTTNYGIRLGNGMLKIYGTADKIHSVMLRKIAFLYS